MSFIETVCPRDCYDTCFVNVSVRDGELIRTMGDKPNVITQGVLCPRGYKDIKRLYSDERVLYPHHRVRNKFKRISWDDALSLLVEKLKTVLDSNGPHSCLQLNNLGNQGLLSAYLPQRLFYALGFTQTDWSICSKSGHDALSLHYGLTYGIDPEELPSMGLTVYWGFNAAVSAFHLHRLSLKSQKKGGIIVAVDPRKSETAESADIWIQIKPGSDTALAYGILKYVIETDSIDHAFIEKYTSGFDLLKAEVAKWDSSTIEKYTGIPWDKVVELAELYTNHTHATMIGIGMQKSLHGAEAVRAISLIPAVLGVHRGFFYSNNQKWYVDMPSITGETLTDKDIPRVSQVAVGTLLEKGAFKFVYIHNSNPAQTLPNSAAVTKGLQRKDTFVVVHDTHWTETARCADLVLPAPTYFEKEDIVIPYSHKYIKKSKKVVEPLGESKSEVWVTHQVAAFFSCDTWVVEPGWEAIEKELQTACESDITDLQKGKIVTLKMRPESAYQTPTKKIELYATQGDSPLPVQYPLPENSFILLNSAVKNYTHTQFQDIYGAIPSLVFMNREDARYYNIKDTDTVELYNELGSIKLKAVISVSVPQGVLWTPRQGKDIEGTPQNSIMPDTTQKIGGGPIFNSTLVKIRTHPGERS